MTDTTENWTPSPEQIASRDEVLTACKQGRDDFKQVLEDKLCRAEMLDQKDRITACKEALSALYPGEPSPPVETPEWLKS